MELLNVNKDYLEELLKIWKKEGKYRPDGVIVLYDSDKNFFIVRYNNPKRTWGFVQEGFEDFDLGLEDCLARGLKEEINIDYKNDLTNIKHGFYLELLDDKTKPKKYLRGFTNGKGYIHTLAKYNGSKEKIKLNKNELLEGRWVSCENAVRYYFSKIRPEKARMLKQVITIAKSLI